MYSFVSLHLALVNIELKKLPLLGVVFLLSHFFLGWSVNWSFSLYDELRLMQLIITVLFFITLIFNDSLKFSTYNIFLFISLLLFIVCCVSFLKIYILQDILTLVLLPIWVLFLSLNLSSVVFDKYKYLFLIIILSIFPCFFLFISIYTFLKSGIWHGWHLSSGSIRVFDSVIVPIIFLAIYLKLQKYKYISNIYPLIVFLLTLGLWFDGARAALLSILMGLVVVFIFSKQHRKLVLGTAAIILFSFAVYQLTYYFYNQIHEVEKSLNIIRTTTSGRWELWGYAYQKWIEQPWRGVGGNFLASTDYPLNHLHNFYLKLIFEWGVLGFVFLCWIFFQLKKVLTSNGVHIALKAGICAVAVDAFFSGNLVYPASQISIVLLLGLAFAQYKPDVQVARKTKYLSKIVILLWFGLYIFILGNYFLQDLLCLQCGSHAELMAPGFWYYGKAEHLIHHSFIP